MHFLRLQFETIKNKLDRRTNKVTEETPKSVKSGDGCDVILKPMRPLVVEAFKSYPPLGRFAVRDMRMTVAVGVINSVTRKVADTKGKK
jgi:elongation factor 1-alpha